MSASFELDPSRPNTWTADQIIEAVLGTREPGDTVNRWQVGPDGRQAWSDGSHSADAILERVAGGLSLTGGLRVSGPLEVDGGIVSSFTFAPGDTLSLQTVAEQTADPLRLLDPTGAVELAGIDPAGNFHVASGGSFGQDVHIDGRLYVTGVVLDFTIQSTGPEDVPLTLVQDPGQVAPLMTVGGPVIADALTKPRWALFDDGTQKWSDGINPPVLSLVPGPGADRLGLLRAGADSQLSLFAGEVQSWAASGDRTSDVAEFGAWDMDHGALNVRADGALLWSDGTNPPDVRLWRDGAQLWTQAAASLTALNLLPPGDAAHYTAFIAAPHEFGVESWTTLPSDDVFHSGSDGDTGPWRFVQHADGAHVWSDGINPPDTTLERFSPGSLNVAGAATSLGLVTTNDPAGLGGTIWSAMGIDGSGNPSVTVGRNPAFGSSNGSAYDVWNDAAHDSYEAWRLDYHGAMQWSDGINPPDVALARLDNGGAGAALRLSNAGSGGVDGWLEADKIGVSDPVFASQVDGMWLDRESGKPVLEVWSAVGDTASERVRFWDWNGVAEYMTVLGDGTHLWGDGTHPPDVNLYREAAGLLRTDGGMDLAGSVLRITGDGGPFPSGPYMRGNTGYLVINSGVGQPLYLNQDRPEDLWLGGGGGTTHVSGLIVNNGEAEVLTPGDGLIVHSPDGTKRARIGIDNAGALSVTAL